MISAVNLDACDREAVIQFFLGLDASLRTRRFGGGYSDDAIVRWGAALNHTCSIVVVDLQGDTIETLVELHALGEDWGVATLELTSSLRQAAVRAPCALRFAASLALERQCRTIVLEVDDVTLPHLPVLRELGELTFDGRDARIALTPSAASHQSAAGPTEVSQS